MDSRLIGGVTIAFFRGTDDPDTAFVPALLMSEQPDSLHAGGGDTGTCRISFGFRISTRGNDGQCEVAVAAAVMMGNQPDQVFIDGGTAYVGIRQIERHQLPAFRQRQQRPATMTAEVHPEDTVQQRYEVQRALSLIHI